MHDIELRDANKTHMDLVFSITEDAMRPYVEETWGTWESEEQYRQHIASFKPETHKIILSNGVTAGVVAVEEFPTYVWLIKLFVMERYRSTGIGSYVLEYLLKQERIRQKLVTLQVLRVNTRAQTLYAKHGFTVKFQNTHHLFMAREA